MKKSQSVISKFGAALDPFLILGIFILFLIPVITVINLTPGEKTVRETESVLGSTDPERVSILANTAPAEGITVDKVTQNSEKTYTMYVLHDAHEAGTYTNALFTATNGTPDEKQINITSTFESVPADTTVSLMVEGVRFIILDEDGTTYPPTLYLTPDSATNADIEIQSENDVNFSSGFSLVLTVN